MKKLFIATLVAVLAFSLMTPLVLAKPDKDKPLSATNVELVKKVTLKGKPVGGGKPAKLIATGIKGASCSGNKYAIVIGISDYPRTANDLSYADEDAADMITALTTYYGYPANNIISLIDVNSAIPPNSLNASFTAIYTAVNTVKGWVASDTNPGEDEVVFFFSGHGAKGNAPDNDNERIDESIVCHDGNQNGELLHIWDGQLKDWFADFQTSRIIFILDSCLSGGMTDLAAAGRIINMATTESGVSYEDSWWGGGHGQFTFYFVDQGMLGGKADRYDHDSDLFLSEPQDVAIEEAFDYAKTNCESQKPTVSDRFENDLIL